MEAMVDAIDSNENGGLSVEIQQEKLKKPSEVTDSTDDKNKAVTSVPVQDYKVIVGAVLSVDNNNTSSVEVYSNDEKSLPQKNDIGVEEAKINQTVMDWLSTSKDLLSTISDDAEQSPTVPEVSSSLLENNIESKVLSSSLDGNIGPTKKHFMENASTTTTTQTISLPRHSPRRRIDVVPYYKDSTNEYNVDTTKAIDISSVGKKLKKEVLLHKPKYPIGTRVSKYFDGYDRPFIGIVVKFDPIEQYYCVQYVTDNDMEEYSEHALSHIVLIRNDTTGTPDDTERYLNQLPMYGIGTLVGKFFPDETNPGEDKLFIGTVTNYDAFRGFYSIQYEDGDAEDLNDNEITHMIQTLLDNYDPKYYKMFRTIDEDKNVKKRSKQKAARRRRSLSTRVAI